MGTRLQAGRQIRIYYSSPGTDSESGPGCGEEGRRRKNLITNQPQLSMYPMLVYDPGHILNLRLPSLSSYSLVYFQATQYFPTPYFKSLNHNIEFFPVKFREP